jgi:hypothetical protein
MVQDAIGALAQRATGRGFHRLLKERSALLKQRRALLQLRSAFLKQRRTLLQVRSVFLK